MFYEVSFPWVWLRSFISVQKFLNCNIFQVSIRMRKGWSVDQLIEYVKFSYCFVANSAPRVLA